MSETKDQLYLQIITLLKYNDQLKQAMVDNCPHSRVQCGCGLHYKLPSERACKVCRIAKLEAYIELHAGDWCSLSNESDMFRERCEEAEASNLALLATMADMKEELTYQWIDAEHGLKPVEHSEKGQITGLTKSIEVVMTDGQTITTGYWYPLVNEWACNKNIIPLYWLNVTLPPEKEEKR